MRMECTHSGLLKVPSVERAVWDCLQQWCLKNAFVLSAGYCPRRPHVSSDASFCSISQRTILKILRCCFDPQGEEIWEQMHWWQAVKAKFIYRSLCREREKKWMSKGRLREFQAGKSPPAEPTESGIFMLFTQQASSSAIPSSVYWSIAGPSLHRSAKELCSIVWSMQKYP